MVKPCRVMLGLHGFNDYRETFDDLASALSADCVAFYAYDQRGFGATVDRGSWPGRSRLVNDAISVASLLRERYPGTPLYVAGESMGGAVALLALAQNMPVDGAVLMAPAVWARDIQPWYQRFGLWLGVRLMPNAKLASAWIDIDPSDDPEVLEYWRSHPDGDPETRVSALYGVNALMDAALQAANELQTRALILYGGEDEVIPPEATCALLKELEEAPADWRFVYYPEGYHMLARYSGAAATIQDIREWLQSSIVELPSGGELQPVAARDKMCSQ
ncbi:MAG: alpha/beta fold hydrolase [Gammaproteobacteria bacterium]|nr:alpha/beta fold hydrolase [Gammaproteobacteria bacterium]